MSIAEVTMSPGQSLREFINERLTAAAEEIFGAFEETIVQYEEEIDRQRKLLDTILKPGTNSSRIDMDEWVSDLTSSLSSVFSQEDAIQRVVEVIQNIGVCSAEDLKYVEADDLAASRNPSLKPIEIRKVMACIKQLPSVMSEVYSSSLLISETEEASIGEETFVYDADRIDATPKSTASRSPVSLIPMRSRASPTTSGSGSSPLAREDSNWHYTFDVPWNKMPSKTREVLDTEKRPTAAERREIIRIVAAEILTVCKKPGKRHINEIARKMVICYPKSFRDEIEGQVVGTGYDSLVKQLVSRIDNCRRHRAPCAQKRPSESDTPDNAKKACKDAYGCINPDPELPAGETKDKQKQKQEELMNMFNNKDKDAKKIERLMVETFPSQRKDVLSGLKETEDILKEWPFLCQEIGMRLHFRELTGVQIDDRFEESTATKFKRILRYFQFVQTEPSRRAGTILNQALAGGDETCAAVLMLLVHFKEQEDKMLLNVDDNATATDVDTTKLPWTPCIVVCGNSPLTAKMFMVAVDQIIVNEQLPCFTKAVQMMFCSYYLHNIDYPVELAATLEFLQRCIFKINPDQGTKVKRKEKGHQYTVNPRVLSLISKIANFEWTE